ncbi:hypothetical protein U5U50_03090 [Mycoplasma sp. 888]|uniref:hypothetical protein n=1 Tax=Mycoplasma sp. 888 TaxID=3108483 RepID=UPI002D7853F1|nr:hypothetical protein [Mycoplasma sp. 888]WRQ25766.1 hypothetical protein U5U50_03090 [Mycoplasma sp. 888]
MFNDEVIYINFLQNSLEEVINDVNNRLNLIDYKQLANIPDVKQESWEDKTQKKTIGDIIFNSLRKKYPQKSSYGDNFVNTIFREFLMDVQNHNNIRSFKLRILDNISFKDQAGSDKFLEYWKNFQSNPRNGIFFKNIVLTVNFSKKFIERKKWKQDSCNLFFSLKWNPGNKFYFTLNKITFINDYTKYREDREFVFDPKSVKFVTQEQYPPITIDVIRRYYETDLGDISFKRNNDLDFDILLSLIDLFINNDMNKSDLRPNNYLMNLTEEYKELKIDDETEDKEYVVKNLHYLTKTKLTDNKQEFSLQLFSSKSFFSKNKFIFLKHRPVEKKNILDRIENSIQDLSHKIDDNHFKVSKISTQINQIEKQITNF